MASVYDLEYNFKLVRQYEADGLDRAQEYREYLRDAFDQRPNQEQIWMACLDIHNKVVCRKQIAVGLVGLVVFGMQDLFAPALAPNVNASKIIMAHNHPSGDTTPSDADIKCTKRVKETGIALGVPCVEHLIFGDRFACPNGVGYYSFAEAGFLKDDFEPEELILR